MWEASGMFSRACSPITFFVVDVHFDEALAERRQLDVGLLEVGQLQELQRFAEWEQIVNLEAERVGEMGQIGLAIVWRSGDLL